MWAKKNKGSVIHSSDMNSHVKRKQYDEGFRDYRAESYWNGLNTTFRNRIGDKALNSNLSMKTYFKIMNSKWSEIPLSQRNQIKKFIDNHHKNQG